MFKEEVFSMRQLNIKKQSLSSDGRIVMKGEAYLFIVVHINCIFNQMNLNQRFAFKGM